MNLSSLLGTVRKKTFAATAVRPARQRPRLIVDTLESREVPATLPAPVVDQTSFRSIDGDAWAFSMMADPTNPDQIFGAYVTHAGNGTRIGYKYTSDGGQTWSNGGVFNNNSGDPVHLPAFVEFEDVSDPSVAWDRFGNVFLTYTEHHPDNTAGIVSFRKFTFNGTPSQTGPKTTLYSWFNSTGVANPQVAVDSNLSVDPTVAPAAGQGHDDLAAIQTAANRVRVFVTYNTQVVDTGNATPGNVNPNAIIMRYSVDGGATFSGSLLMNDDGYNVAGPYVFSKTVFTPGRTNEPNSGGRMVTVFSSNTGGPGNAPTLKTDTMSFNNTAGIPNLFQFAGTDGGSFNTLDNSQVRTPTPPPNNRSATISDAIDASNPDNDIAVSTVINFDVNNVFRLDSISLTLHINHDALRDLDAVLIGPDGVTQIPLFQNRTTNSGGDRGGAVGLDGKTLGGGGSGDTTFTDAAFWSINSNSAGAKEPYYGDYLPESTFRGTNPLISTFQNLNSFNGTWKLVITDHRNGNAGSLSGATLRLGSAIRNGGGQDRGVPGVSTTAANVLGTNHPTKAAFNPTAGLASNPVVAVDNSLGAFSPYQDRIYVAYSNGGSVQLLYSDGVDATGGQLWNTQPITAGAGYLPELAIDQNTGTLALAYYTSAFDASGTRSTMVMQTSVNAADYKDRTGSIEFSARTPVTPVEQAFDQIRSKVITTEPVPANGTVASDARMWGNSFGLYATDGRINLVYPSNLDLAGTQLRTQNIEIATGPRVVGGDMGPILGNASVTPLQWINHSGTLGTATFVPGHTASGPPITYNSATGSADGRNRFTAFMVTFDRVIDPATFSPADIQVIFRGPTDDPVGAGTIIPVGAITALDNIRDPIDDSAYGSKRFLVILQTPQTNVGTYSYLIGSHVVGTTALIQDRVKGPGVTFTNAGPPQTFTHVGGPDQIQDFTGTPAPTVTTINVPPGAFGGGVVIGAVTVQVDITHSNVNDLQLTLTSPTGQTITLVNQGDALGANFVGTVFDDTAPDNNGDGVPDTIATSPDVGPYTGSYAPVQPLRRYLHANPAGNWTLTVTDLASGDTGVLNDWSLTIQGQTRSVGFTTGNFIDQNANGTENDLPTSVAGILHTPDGFAMPNPTQADVPFRLPYAVGSLPVAIVGPHVVSTHVPNQVAASTDNLVLNQNVSAIDLTFDRTIVGATFKPANVVRMTGVVSDAFPTGDVPLTGITVTPIDASGNVLPAGSNSRFFRIGGFPAQSLSGTYTIQLTAQVLDPVTGDPVAQIKDTTGNLLDTNTNAGIGNLVGTVTGATVQTKTYGGDVPGSDGSGVSIPAKGSLTVPLDIDEAYLLKKASVNISIDNFPGGSYRDLEGRLVAPDGTSVLLFAKAPATGNGDMHNITLTDDSIYPDPLSGQPRPTPSIEDGVSGGGTYNPTQPFQPLIDHASQGTWKLVIKNLGTQTGKVTKFKLFLDKPVISSGLGEDVADRVTASFRIARVDGSQDIAKDNWTPVGPAPQIDGNGINSTAGRVSSIAVDPSDPSGNTVYAAGASGGVWRTNNFLTRDPDGPNWIPLADFGPNNAINVGFLQVYNSPSDPNTNGDPNKTIVLVGTGSAALNVIDAEDQRRFDGVGFLLSEDAGTTWQVLDSTSNFDIATQSYRPLVDPGTTSYTVKTATEAGNTVTITTNNTFTNPHEFKPGMVVKVAGVSVAGYNGTFVVTSATATTFTYTNPTAGLAAGTGGTAIAVDRRDHLFVGAVVNKVVFEKNPDAGSERPIIWAAVGQGSTPAGNNVAGLWRSTDGGRSWTQVFQGNASDFVLAPGSQLPNSGDRPTIGYLAVQGGAGGGAYFTSNLNADHPSFSLMNGGTGRPTINTGSIPVGASETPNGDFGKITLATPAFVNGSPLANNYYQRWLYAAVADTNGTFRGLYMTKDRGLNWTKIAGLSNLPNQTDITLNPNAPGGNHSLALAVDPNDPNIVYVGSNALLRVDATQINDPYNLTMYSYDEAAGGVRFATSEGVTAADLSGVTVGGGLLSVDPNTQLNSLTPGTGNFESELDRLPRKKWNQLNLDRDPYRPFRRDTAIGVTNVANFLNDGTNVTWTLPGEAFGNGAFDYNWVSQIYTFQDPLTGQARTIVGSDEGIVSYVSNADGSNMRVNGFVQDFQIPDVGAKRADLQITGSRNGNLQVARLYSGDAQPSLLAANIADSLLYGAGRRLGDVQASEADPGDGTIVWDDGPLLFRLARPDTANYVAADQSGTGNVYILRRINDMAPIGDNPVNFFQISKNGGAPVSFTNGLFQSNADAQGAGQWTNQVKTFAVNPIDASGIMMGSAAGRLFLTTDTGLNWNPKGEPAVLDGSISTALAFGAPLPSATDLNQYLYYGSQNGNIFVTTDAGGATGTNWLNITTGSFGTLDGSAIQKIVANPTRGSNELFAVTRNGVYHMANWDLRDDQGNRIAQWEDITQNIKQITTLGFGHDDWELPLLSTTNPITTIAVDWRPTFAPTPAAPILYVGGDGGVFQARYNADQTTWIRYTGPKTNGAASPGGGLPVVKVTDLDLALGDIDRSNGRPKSAGAPGLLVATTLGRGTWSIGLDVPAGVAGPRVVASTPSTLITSGTGFSTVTVTFDQFITGRTFTASDVVMTLPDGSQINPVADPVDVTSGTDPAGTVWQITFPTQTADGTYTIKIGPHVADGNVEMDQNGNKINGEAGDAFTFKVVIGRNDLSDFVNDTFTKLLGRVPTTVEYTGATSTTADPNAFGKTIPTMSSARLTALGTVVKELLSTFNNNELRTSLVTRLFDNGGAANEIGNLLPASAGYVLTPTEVSTLVTGLKNGTKSPESIITYILTKPEYFTAAGSTAGGFLDRLYRDLFKGTNVTFAKLPLATQTTQLNQAATPTGRGNLIRSLVAGTAVKWDSDGVPTTPEVATYDHDNDPNTAPVALNFRNQEVNLLYQRLLGRFATAAEISAGKTLMARPLAAGSIQGSEWVLWKVLSSQEYFDRQTQLEGLPDDLLHTDRSWVDGVIRDQGHRASLVGERDTYSQKILDKFKTQRTAFVRAVVNSREYRSIKITEYYQLVLQRNPTNTTPTSELPSWLTKMGNGTATFTTVVSTLLGSLEYYNRHTTSTDPVATKNHDWAKAVYVTVLGRPATSAEETALVNKVGTLGRVGAAASVLNSTDSSNGPTWRDKLITAAFTLSLGRPPVGTELTAYEKFLQTNRWESLFVDIMSNGAADLNPALTGVQNDLPRQYWEVAN